jgi:hypothetical protein
MAAETPLLGLILPANGEYTNTWDVPINQNTQTIDTVLGNLQAEVIAARGNLGSLSLFLEVSMDANGNITGIPEIVASRTSQVYGIEASLSARLLPLDMEVFTARSGLTTLQAMIAFAADDDVSNTVISGPLPSSTALLTASGAVVTCNGATTPVVCNINGYRQVVRTNKTVTISGGAATYYVYLQTQSSGDMVLDSTGGGQNNGAVSVDGDSNLTLFTDITQNFGTLGVQPGDLLTITSGGSNDAGTFVVGSIQNVTVGLTTYTNAQIVIKGLFVDAETLLNYKIVNPLAPALYFTGTAPANRYAEVTGKIYVGSCVFDGTNVTSVVGFAYKGRYEGFTSVTLSGGAYSLTISHNLGYMPTQVQLFGSQVNTYASLDPIGIDGVAGSAVATMTTTTIQIAQTLNGTFYKSFAGTTETSGYLLVKLSR